MRSRDLIVATPLLFALPLLAAVKGERPAEPVVDGASGMAVSPISSEVSTAIAPVRELRFLTLSARPVQISRPEQKLVDAPRQSGPGVSPGMSLVEQLPVVGAVRRRAGDRLNTTDGSHPNDFAICYRVSDRMGFQVIPGDPTPNKLPVTTLANNMGVTVGMTLRIGTGR